MPTDQTPDRHRMRQNSPGGRSNDREHGRPTLTDLDNDPLDPTLRRKMGSPGRRGVRAFEVLRVRNYRLYFASQLISVSGSSMQLIGQTWLMLQLHGSGFALGALTAAQFMPMLLFGPYGGLIADRSNKRRLITITQFLSALSALLLGVLTVTGTVEVWTLFVVAFATGCIGSVDGPARQVFASEMVPPELVANAVGLNEVMINGARVFGPAVGAIVIVRFGTGFCFFANALSFVPPIVAIALIRARDMHRVHITGGGPRQLREGVRYALRTPIVRTVILLGSSAAAIFNFGVSLPLMATKVLHAGAGGYGSMVAAFGIGAVGGALIAAHERNPTGLRVRAVAIATGVAVVASALMPTLVSELVAMAISGLFSIWFYALANSVVLLRTTPPLRGRVMGLWSMALAGSLPISGPLVGLVAEHIGPREALGAGGVSVLAMAAIGWRILGGDQDEPASPTVVSGGSSNS